MSKKKDEWAPSPKQSAFIKAYFDLKGNKRAAARKAKIAETTVYEWLKIEEFRSLLKGEEQALCDELLEKAFKDAKAGDKTLLMFFLKAFRPEQYDDNVRKLKWAEERGIQPDKQRIEVVINDAAKP